jgi:hypothetical protein
MPPSSDPGGPDLGFPLELPGLGEGGSIATKELLDDASMEEMTLTPPPTDPRIRVSPEG